jgi:flagellar protein FlaG
MRIHGVERIPQANWRQPAGTGSPEDDGERLIVNLRTFDKQYLYDIHRETKRLIIRVVDAETSEIIREVPPEEILNLVARMEETLGRFVDLRM